MRPPFQWLRIVLVMGMVGAVFQKTAEAAENAGNTAARLAADCDALLEAMIRKPYGWALPSAEATEQRLPRGAAAVNLDVMGSPTAGLLLLYAGQTLGRQDYRDAAWQLGRGLMAAQQRNGRIPGRATFSNSATNRDVGEALQSRQSTAAALALLLALAEERPEDDALRRGAHRAALWIVMQQPPAGGFPSVVEVVDSQTPVKMLRLDYTDYRDAVLAMVYAEDVLDQMIFKRGIDRAVAQLMKMRIDGASSRTAKGLWRAAYELDGSPSVRIASLDSAVDTLATRYVMQALLADHVFRGSEQSLAAMNDAAASLAPLRYEDGKWQRLYELKSNEIKPIERGPAPVGTINPFERPLPLEKDLYASSTFDLVPVLEAVEQIRISGRAEYQAKLPGFGARRQVALTLAGLTDHPLTMPFPGSPEEARAALADGSGPWQVTDAPGAPTVEQRIERMYGFLLRLRVEKLAAKP